MIYVYSLKMNNTDILMLFFLLAEDEETAAMQHINSGIRNVCKDSIIVCFIIMTQTVISSILR